MLPPAFLLGLPYRPRRRPSGAGQSLGCHVTVQVAGCAPAPATSTGRSWTAWARCSPRLSLSLLTAAPATESAHWQGHWQAEKAGTAVTQLAAAGRPASAATGLGGEVVGTEAARQRTGGPGRAPSPSHQLILASRGLGLRPLNEVVTRRSISLTQTCLPAYPGPVSRPAGHRAELGWQILVMGLPLSSKS